MLVGLNGCNSSVDEYTCTCMSVGLNACNSSVDECTYIYMSVGLNGCNNSVDECTFIYMSVGLNDCNCVYIGLAKTIYIRCMYGTFGRKITKYTVIYGAYIRFWPTLLIHFLYLAAYITLALLRKLLAHFFTLLHHTYFTASLTLLRKLLVHFFTALSLPYRCTVPPYRCTLPPYRCTLPPYRCYNAAQYPNQALYANTLAS